jgi:ankyrin repeat protein
MRQFLELEAYVNTNVGWYGSPFQGAAKRGSLATVTLLLEHGADVNIRGGKHGFTLQAAVCYYPYHKPDTNTSFLKLLLVAGADVNAEGGLYGSALQAAAYRNVHRVKMLIEHGADVNQKGGRFGSPLGAAKANGLYRVVKLLLEHGVEDLGEPPLFLARRVGLKRNLQSI